MNLGVTLIYLKYYTLLISTFYYSVNGNFQLSELFNVVTMDSQQTESLLLEKDYYFLKSVDSGFSTRLDEYRVDKLGKLVKLKYLSNIPDPYEILYYTYSVDEFKNFNRSIILNGYKFDTSVTEDDAKTNFYKKVEAPISIYTMQLRVKEQNKTIFVISVGRNAHQKQRAMSFLKKNPIINP